MRSPSSLWQGLASSFNAMMSGEPLLLSSPSPLTPTRDITDPLAHYIGGLSANAMALLHGDAVGKPDYTPVGYMARHAPNASKPKPAMLPWLSIDIRARANGKGRPTRNDV